MKINDRLDQIFSRRMEPISNKQAVKQLIREMVASLKVKRILIITDPSKAADPEYFTEYWVNTGWNNAVDAAEGKVRELGINPITGEFDD